MSSSFGSDIRHVLRLGQLGKSVVRTRKSSIAWDAGQAPRIVVITPIPYFIEDPIWLLCQVHLKSDMIGDFIRFFGPIVYATTKRDDCNEIDKSLSAFPIID